MSSESETDKVLVNLFFFSGMRLNIVMSRTPRFRRVFEMDLDRLPCLFLFVYACVAHNSLALCLFFELEPLSCFMGQYHTLSVVVAVVVDRFECE